MRKLGKILLLLLILFICRGARDQEEQERLDDLQAFTPGANLGLALARQGKEKEIRLPRKTNETREIIKIFLLVALVLALG